MRGLFKLIFHFPFTIYHFAMRFLALDIGTRRTGVAYLDTDVGIPLPLETVRHTTQEQLVDEVMRIILERKIDRVIVGLPLLLSGAEGGQSGIARATGALIEKAGVVVRYADERFSTPGNSTHKNVVSAQNYDGDAAAACSILSGKIDY